MERRVAAAAAAAIANRRAEDGTSAVLGRERKRPEDRLPPRAAAVGRADWRDRVDRLREAADAHAAR
eukprot:6992282-Prymnesium_polylepis.1